MKKKAQGILGGAIIPIFIVLLLGVIFASIVWRQIDEQTAATAITNDVFTGVSSNTTCIDVTTKCIYSLTSVTNNTGGETVGTGNYSLCDVNGGVRYNDGIVISATEYNSETLNATYTEIECNHIESGLTRTIVRYLPIFIALALLIFLVGYVTIKGG